MNQSNSPLNRAANVLVFDSGVGGLTIAAEIRKQLPGVSITYVSDNAAFPYGTKSEDFLIPRVQAVLTACQQHISVDLIVVACNTASTLVLPVIRQHFNVPIVGVVPAIKPAALASTTKNIGLLATPGTIERRYTQNLIDDYASHCRVVKVGSSRLVQIAEEKLQGLAVSLDEIKHIINPLLNDQQNNAIDTVVLACTHFPLLKAELSSLAPPHWLWLDSGEAIARRVNHLLTEIGFAPKSGTDTQFNGLVTRADPLINSLLPALKQFGFAQISQLQLTAQ